MNEFEVVLTPEAQSDIRTLGGAMRTHILDKLEWMGANAALIRHQAMKGKRWHGVFKYRIGNYRIIYQLKVDERQFIVLKVGHRRDVYKP
ncbi:MAG: type II toxin-antitoxin system RelE/ParE family toxin [Chloroflexi bacterium]|nr:type II toxin-antitoxin system RelE/ParE family toxin [Chloroflexota bacterium]